MSTPVKWPEGQSSITDPSAVYVVSLFDVFEDSNVIVHPAWCKKNAVVPHMWDKEIEAALGKDGLEALRSRCREFLFLHDYTHCFKTNELDFVDAPHAYLDDHLYEIILKQRIPGIRAVGGGIVFSVPDASTDSPAGDEDVLRLIYSVIWTLGKADERDAHPEKIRVRAVPTELINIVEAIVRSNTSCIRAAWDALDPTVRDSIRPNSFIGKKIERLGILK